MKKITTYLTVMLLLSASVLNAQYYFNSFPAAGQNPGNLNPDLEYPSGGGLTTGWTAIVGPNATTPVWSSNRTIPFSFDFNGSPVTQYKVSSTGVLTFTTTATAVPGSTPAALPSASIPDNSVCVWGLSASGTNDIGLTKTFGTAPNRQHWIFFSSCALGGTGWSYWSIVLEETTNKIYIVDQRHSGTTGGVSAGIQIDGTTATSIPGSPNLLPLATTDPSAADNAYYEFIQGTRPADDIEMVSLAFNSVPAGGTSTISGTLKNNGGDTLKTYTLTWTADGGTTLNTQVINTSVAPLASSSFNHPTTWTPAGGIYTLQVYSSLPNGNPDANTSNDTIIQSVAATTGASVSRHVMLEEFTTSVCQFCPDGTYNMELILNANPTVIGAGLHAGFGTDSMTIPAHSAYAAAFTGGAPSAMVDRIKYAAESEVAFSNRSQWGNRSVARASEPSAVDVSLGGTYNAGTRQASIDIDAMFVDYIVPGDLRVTLYVIEDSVSKTGPSGVYYQGWDQVNAYYGTSGHPYYQVGTPTATPGLSVIQGFQHRHVVRQVYPLNDAWGDNTVIPSTPALSTTYSKNFTFNIPADWKTKDISLAAFVSYFDADVEKRQILNAAEIDLDLITGLSKNAEKKTEFKIYPNPSSQETTVAFNLTENSNVEVYVLDIAGKEMLRENLGTKVQGKHNTILDVSNLAKGIYFVNVSVNGNISSKKLSVIK